MLHHPLLHCSVLGHLSRDNELSRTIAAVQVNSFPAYRVGVTVGIGCNGKTDIRYHALQFHSCVDDTNPFLVAWVGFLHSNRKEVGLGEDA